jgi:hypothetical protein
VVGDDGAGHDGFANAGRSDENTPVVVDEMGDGGRLLGSQ